MRDQMYTLASYRVAQTKVVGIASYTTNTLKFWTATGFADLIAHGGAAFHGNASDVALSGSVVDIEDNDPWGGYWMVTDDGQILNFSAADYGSLPALGISVTNIVDIVARPQGNGYWLLGSDGGVFSFGAAGFYGSLPGLGLSISDAVSIEVNKTGNGYRIVRNDGSVARCTGSCSWL